MQKNVEISIKGKKGCLDLYIQGNPKLKLCAPLNYKKQELSFEYLCTKRVLGD